MRSLKVMFVGASVALGCFSVAFAADMPDSGFGLGDLRPSVEGTPSGSWTGVYAGANMGSAWNNSRVRYDSFSYPATSLTNKQNAEASFTGGVQAGYNYQEDELIYGIEADFSLGAGSGRWKTSTSEPFAYPAPTAQSYLRSKTNLNWFGTVRGRLGYALSGDFMMYGTAGVAFGEVEGKAEGGVTASPLSPFAATSWKKSKSYTGFGWAAGIGGEYAIDRNWSLKGEYLRIDLGSKTYVLAGGGPLRQKTTADIVRLGLNYQFR